MATQGCRCAVLLTLFLIKVVFCVSSRKFIYQLYGCLKANILDYGRGRSFAFQISVTLFLVRPKSLWEPLNQIESLSPSKFVCESQLKHSVSECNTDCSHEAVSKTANYDWFNTTYYIRLLIGIQRKETLFELMNILISEGALC